MTNQELLTRAGAVMGAMGVSKALTPTVPTTDSLAAGEFMNRKQVEQLVDLTVSQSGWLGKVSTRLRNARSGQIPRLVLNDVVTEGVGENQGATVSTHPDTDYVEYEARKFQATWYLTVEDVREARVSGDANFDATVRAAFAKAMGNDMARAALLGDTSLPASSRLNRLLRQRDGWLKRIRAAANRRTTTLGSAFDPGLFSSMQDSLPEIYRDDPELLFLVSSKLDMAWSKYLQDLGAGSALSDRALIERRRFDMAGIQQLVLPQMPVDLGFATVSGSASDADAVADDGDGTLTATVNTLFGGAAAGHAGRRVRITFDATGQSEVCTVTWNGSALRIATAGSLGQSTISTTASAYTLDLADLMPAVLCNPKNLFMVLCDRMRAYQRFEQEFERYRIDVFYEADFGLFNEDAIAMQDGIIAPSFTFGA